MEALIQRLKQRFCRHVIQFDRREGNTLYYYCSTCGKEFTLTL